MVSDSGEWLSSSFQWGWKENIAIFCWAIWGARNKKVWQQKCSADIEVVSTAWSVLDQWSNAWIRCHSSSLVDLSQGGDAEQWVLSCKIRSRLTLMVPISKKKKKNIDGATFEAEGRVWFWLCGEEPSRWFHMGFGR